MLKRKLDFDLCRPGRGRRLPLAVLTVLLGGLIGLDAPVRAEVEILESQDAPTGSLSETPVFKEQVNAGELPPVQARVPAVPRLAGDLRGDIELGRHGGDLRTMVTRTKDTRLMVVYGYARLVAYDPELNLRADILRKLEIEDGRIFTMHLRDGHRWSDGHPFTSEDFRFWWEDVANNPEISPVGPPAMLKVDGELPEVEILDETTVRYSWSQPNPYFVNLLAGARPLFIYSPSHYLKQFHIDYGDKQEIELLVEQEGARNWAQLYNRRDNLYRFDNPDLPTLQPWRNEVPPPSQRFVMSRNPYYHVVDAEGRQLPYIDRVVMNVVGPALVAAKASSGEADLQSRGLNFTDYTFLKEAEARNDFDVRLWRTVRGSQLALYPNLNVQDPVWRGLIRDVRFRRALSLAIDRHEINQVIYFGLCIEGNNTVLPDSPLYEEHFRKMWAEHNVAKANALLDEIGLTGRNSEGIRLLPNGSPAEIVVETAGENTEETDVLQLIAEHWRKAGIKLFIKPSQREVLRNRVFAGETVMAMWYGIENGIPTAEMSPYEFAPMRQHSLQWPMWGQYHETAGAAGKPVDMPKAKELKELYFAWTKARSRAERREIWTRMLEINANQVYTIGLVAEVPQPILVSRKLHNVPKEAFYNWEPGAQLGIYRPEVFWFDK